MVANVPIVVVSFVLAVLLVPESRDPEHRRLDPVGAVLSIVAVSTVVFAFIESPARGWGSAPVLVALVVFATATAGFVAWELRHDAPMLDVRLFRSALFTVPALVITFGFFVAWGIQFLIPQYLQFLQGESVLTVGLVMATISVTWSISAPLIPRVVARVGERRVMAAALLVTAAGVACFLAVDTDVTIVAVLVGLAAIGVGMGSTTTPATSMLVSSLPPEKAGVGSAMNDVTREAGAAFGVAVLGSVLALRFTDQVERAVAGTRGQRARALDGIHSAQDVARRLGGTKGARLRDAADAAFTSGFRLAAVVGVAILVLVAVLVLVKLPRRRGAAADAVR
jgi:MFS family permease